MRFRSTTLAVALASALTFAACGGADEADTSAEADADATEASEPTPDAAPADPEEGSGDGAGVRLVSAEDAAAIQASPPPGLVVLDVRTPEEFAEGHLEGATMIDFYEPDFLDRIGELDPDVPYLLYCRSGNRSGQARAMMEALGFTDLADVDGGVISWAEAGLPLTQS